MIEAPVERRFWRAVRVAGGALISALTLAGCAVPPREAPAVVAYAAILIEEGENLVVARLSLEAALKADSMLEEGWYYRGLLFAYDGEDRQADSCFSRALSVDPIHRPALFLRGQMKLREWDLAGAMRDFSELAFLYPRYSDGFRGRAWVLQEAGRSEEAIIEWGRALDVSPEEASLYEERGFARLDAGDADEAAEDFTRAVALDSTLSRSYAGRGEANYRLGLYTLAIGDCDSALRLDDADPDAWLTRARAADDSGQFEVAIASYRRFLRLVPESDADVPGVQARLAALDH